MTFLYYLIFGFVGAFLGTILPGLLNMYAAKISRNEGRKTAILFSIGVSLAVLLEALIALVFGRYLYNHPEIISVLQKVILGVFVSITIYFFFIAKEGRKESLPVKNYSKTNRFFLGFFLSAINFLPVPYWVYMSITFSSFGWFTFDNLNICATVLGAGIGTFLVMIIYIWFFRLKKNQQKLNNLNMSYIIGTLTAIISIITLVKIIKTM